MKTSFKLAGICCAAITCLVCALVVSPCGGEDKPPPAKVSSSTVIPATAQIGNVRVGVTTMEQLEVMFGKGREFTGGHPHGAREWCSHQTGWYIYADGFEYKDAQAKERMVESFEISVERQKVGASDDADFKIHHASAEKKELTILGGIAPGLERSKVIALLAENGINTTTTDNVITWNEKGYNHIRDATPNCDELTYVTWNGKLTFRHDKLEDIYIDCQ